jgi:hypothetical protein
MVKLKKEQNIRHMQALLFSVATPKSGEVSEARDSERPFMDRYPLFPPDKNIPPISKL